MAYKSRVIIPIILALAIIPKITHGAPDEGVLIKGTSEKVYVVENGLKRWIKTADIFNKLGYSWANIALVSENLLNNIPPGKEIGSTSQYPDGTLIRSNGPPVYLIEKGVRRWIPNPQIFETNGFRWKNIIKISDKILNRIKQGEDISSNYKSPNSRPQTFILSGPCQAGQTEIPEIETDQIEFKYSGNNNQGNAKNLSFETFLAGYDKNWQGFGHSYKRNIALPAENKIYAFYVRAKNQDGYYDITPAFCQFQTKLSPYHQQIVISSVSGRATDPKNERIVLRAKNLSNSINITGWTIVTKKSSLLIPQAVKIVHPDSMFNIPRDLILETNETVNIYGGISPIGINAYKTNKCERYYDNQNEYKNCFYEYNQYPDFFKNDWRIYLNRTSEFLDKENEEMILKDKNGLVVDRYSY